jgi:hypothetical protein
MLLGSNLVASEACLLKLWCVSSIEDHFSNCKNKCITNSFLVCSLRKIVLALWNEDGWGCKRWWLIDEKCMQIWCEKCKGLRNLGLLRLDWRLVLKWILKDLLCGLDLFGLFQVPVMWFSERSIWLSDSIRSREFLDHVRDSYLHKMERMSKLLYAAC